MRSFSEFERDINFQKLFYDMERIAPSDLKESSSLFTQEQYSFLTKTMAVMNLALLRQYHEWLSEHSQP